MKRITCVTAVVSCVVMTIGAMPAEAKNETDLTTPDTVTIGQQFTVDLDADTDAVDVQYKACIDELQPDHTWKSLKCITVNDETINTRADHGDFHVKVTAPAHLTQLTFTGSLTNLTNPGPGNNNRSEPQTVDVIAPVVQTDYVPH